MVNRLKIILFNILKKIREWFSGTSISKIPGVNKMYEFLFQHLWPYQDIIEIQGSKMYINFRDENPALRKTFQVYALNRIHEAATTNLFKKIVREGDVVVDLGANIGYFSLLAARLVGKKGKVYAFEPEPRNYNYLLKNIELNGYNNVFAIQKAVSNKTGKTKLYLCPYDSGHHTINQFESIRAYKPDLVEEREEFIEVQTTTLDDFFKEQSIDVIKMDVEGAEMLALLGMDRVIKQSKNLKMFVEFFPLTIRKMGNSPEEFIGKLLEDYGFSIFIIGQDYNAYNKELLRIDNVDKLMAFCKDEKDHLNLFIKKTKSL
jgi:FkbM family methyltransferase